MTITLASIVNSTIAIAVATTATLILVAGSAAPVAAAEAPRTAVIDLAGIDLASPAGEARVATQVARAARRICASGDDRSIAARRDRRACIETALASALPEVSQLAEAARAARPQLADISAPTGPVAR